MSIFAQIVAALACICFFALTSSAAVYTVTKTADTNDGVCDADCSLREAVAAANGTVDNDTIEFSALFNSTQTITLTTGEIVFAANGSLTINGAGANLLTISGNNASRIFSSAANVAVTINGLRFTNGNGVGAANTGRGGAIYNVGGTMVINNSIFTANTAANGGGLNNAASAAPSVPANLTLNNCIVSNNTSTSSGGGMQNFSTSTVTINNSLFMNNTSGGTTGGGGAQLNGGVRITSSTFAINNAPGGAGGGIHSNGTLGTVLTNVTIVGNTSTNNGGGLHRGTTNVNFFIRNSIVAGNNGAADSPDVTNSAAGLDSEGNNIIGNVGTSTGWEASDLLNTNPLLNALADNGGFSFTFLPMSGSPALNAGQNCVVDLSCAANNPPLAVNTDQRGISRPQGPTVDIGAVEVQISAIVTVSGRVVSSGGTPIPNAIVTLSDMNGVVASARTNGLGRFTLIDVTSGQTYSLNASSKEYSFTPQNINVSGNMTGVVITSGSGFLGPIEK